MSEQRTLERLHRAERALIHAGWTHSEGAQEWKPPLGPSTSLLLDEISSLRAQLAAVVKVVDDKLAQYDEIAGGYGGLTELGKHAQRCMQLVRQDIERALTDDTGKS